MPSCKQIGCFYEVSGSDSKFSARSLDSHLATAHGIGAADKASHFGCPFNGCGFEAAGSIEFTAEATRRHLVETHNVDPSKPETLPRRRGR